MGPFDKELDVIVVGAGHAGIEAALAAARMGCETLMITLNLDHIGQMSCNPAIGGIGKGHLVKEIDALGGEMARAIDDTGIQFRQLNTKKGPAVRASRAQADKALYGPRMNNRIEREPGVPCHNGAWQIQEVNEPPLPFSFSTSAITQTQIPCHITYTTLATHQIIRGALDR